MAYAYSGIVHPPAPWSKTLELLRDRLSTVVPRPNGELGNLYRDGADRVSYHADDEKVFGPDPTIAAISFGAERRFILRLNDDHRIRVGVVPPHGSLLVMAGETQTKWKHTVLPLERLRGKSAPE